MNTVYKIQLISLCSLFLHYNVQATSWQELLDVHKTLMTDETFRILQSQLHAFENGDAPNIVHPDVKKISIQENNEACIDIHAMGNTRISMMPDPVQPYCNLECNAGFLSSSFMRFSLYEALCKMIKEIDRLAPLFGYAPGQIHIKVFEGLRTVEVQEALFNRMYETIKIQNPEFTDEQLYFETCKFVSPVTNNIPVHSTGGAVDIRLWDNKNNRYLDTGIFIEDPEHDTELYGVLKEKTMNVPMFSEGITDQQKLHRLLLCVSALNAGLTSYVYEFWHFSIKDRYAAYWREINPEARVAYFGSVDQ
ncbi:hypothetical protein EBQ93_01350 [bacterium]|nr:hypothetical protein [bacterium]